MVTIMDHPSIPENITGSDVETPWPLSYLLTHKCYDVMVLQGEYSNYQCLQYLFGKLLGYAIVIVASTMTKMPQIMKILQARSGQGVSLLSQALMLLTASINTAYAVGKNYPISLWGESIAIAVQTLVICLLIIWYADRQIAVIVYMVAYLLSMIVLLSSLVPFKMLIVLQWGCIPFGSLSKVIQIFVNYKNGNTGQLSKTATLSLNFRSFGRLYTSIKESKDLIGIIEFGIHCVLNVVLSTQVLFYNKRQKTKKK